MRKFLIFLGVLFLAYLGITYYLSSLVLATPDRDLATAYQMSIDRWNLDLDSLTRDYPAPEVIDIISDYDQKHLKGWYYPADSANCAVIFSHGYSENRATMLKYTPFFRRCDCDLLLYDHRGFGESDDSYAAGGYHEATDLLTVHRWLADKTGLSDNRIGWFGESWGAATVLQAAGRGEINPAWLVAESPYSNWEAAVVERGVKDYGPVLHAFTPGVFTWVGLRNDMNFADASPVLAAGNIEVPVMLVHSQQDTFTLPKQSDYIAERIKPELLTYHKLSWGAWHAHNVVWRKEEYEALLGQFVEGWCD